MAADVGGLAPGDRQEELWVQLARGVTWFQPRE